MSTGAMNVIPGVPTSARVMLEVVTRHVDGGLAHVRARSNALSAPLECPACRTCIVFSRNSVELEWMLACERGAGYVSNGQQLLPGMGRIPARHGMQLTCYLLDPANGNSGCAQYEVRLSLQLVRESTPKLDVPDLNLDLPSKLAPSPEVLAGWQALVRSSIERANKHVDVEKEQGPDVWEMVPAQVSSMEWKSSIHRR